MKVVFIFKFSWFLPSYINFFNFYIFPILLFLGKSEPPSIKEINNLPFLCAFIEETLRRFPFSPNGVEHITLEDATLCGYNIPKGTRVKRFLLQATA